MSDHADILVVGGGIVGLAVAHTWLARHPGASGIVLEKEDRVAAHQTGRNSGVIHSGAYYAPGSLKARTCRHGIDLLTRFCDEHAVAWERCGKVIVATRDDELPRLDAIAERATTNGVACEPIDTDRLRDLEPHCAGIRALHVHDTGIVDFVAVCKALVRTIEGNNGRVVTGARVMRILRESDGVVAETTRGDAFRARTLVNCAGLHSDRVTRLAGQKPDARIVPFRGEYYELRPAARRLVNNLIYPVPDPTFPFLGVHFTRMIERDTHGHLVECGPNAVLAFAREGYTRTTINPRDLAGTLTYPAFWRIAAKYWRMGAGEMWRSWSKAAFVRALQRLVPAITARDLEPAPAGVRAQALAPDGKLLDDFSITRAEHVVNVVNAPSPAATASLAIAEHVCDLI